MKERRHSSMEMLSGNVPVQVGPKRRNKPAGRRAQSKIFDDSAVVRGYESVPLIEIDVLPRGGISFETQAVGRIQVCFDVGHVCIYLFILVITLLDSLSTRKSNLDRFLFYF